MIRITLLLLLIGFNTGCGWVGSFVRGSDNTLPPAELKTINQPISIEKIWQTGVSSGTGDTFIKLTPAVVGGRIYVAGHKGDITALEAGNGQTIWQADTDLPISAGVGLGDGLVLVGTSDGDILALRSRGGEEAWRAQASSEILAAPGASDGVVVVRSVDGVFIGFDAQTGNKLWIYNYTVPALTLRGTASPLVEQGVVITGLDTGKLLVLSLENGAPIWEKTIAPPRGRTELDRMVDIDAEPRVIDSTLYVAAYQGNITAIDLRNGNTLWDRDFSSHAGLDADNRSVYIADAEDAVWALDRRNGGSLWKQTDLSGRSLSAPVVSGNHVVVGDFKGYLHWLNRVDGKIEGRVRADSDGIAAPPVYQDGTVYVLGESGKLSAFRVSGGS